MKSIGTFAVLAWLVLLCPLPSVAEEQAGADALAEKMLERLGGRERWAELRNTINGSQQNRAEEPTVVYSVISMDFEAPRFRIETMGTDLHLVRVIDGEDSWRMRRSGAIEDVPEELYRFDMDWYAAHLYRTIHRLAAGDPGLSVTLREDGRLQILEGDERLLWFRLDAKGEPYRFGVRDDETGSLTGPWDFIRDGVHHPRWVSNADGTWRANVKALQINVPLGETLFERPAED